MLKIVLAGIETTAELPVSLLHLWCSHWRDFNYYVLKQILSEY